MSKLHLKSVCTAAVIAVACLALRPARAADPSPAPAAPADLSPDMADALKKLEADPSNNVTDSVEKLQHALAAQFRQTLAAQQIVLAMQKRLAAELRRMTGVIVPANGAQVAGLIEFNEGVSHFTLDVLDLSEDDATPLLKWGLSDDHIGLVARAFSREPEVRADAVADVAKLDGPESDWLFLHLLEDRDRRVSLTAMDAAYDRKPTPAVINALWTMAAGNILNQIRDRQGHQTIVNVHGNPITVYEDDSPINRQDPGPAADVLASYKDPTTSQKIDDLFTELATRAEQQHNSYYWNMMLQGYGNNQGPQFWHLVETTNPHAAVRYLMSAIDNVDENNSQTTTMNDEQLRFSPRIEAAAMVMKMTGQDPADAGLKRVANWGNRWAIKGDVKEEEAMLAKLHDWWKQHAKEYGVDLTAPPAQ